MGRTARRNREREAGKLRAILDQLDAGKIRVRGPGHSVARTRARLQERIAELEGGGGNRRG